MMKRGTDKLNKLPRITQPVSGRIWMQGIWCNSGLSYHHFVLPFSVWQNYSSLFALKTNKVIVYELSNKIYCFVK